ncbi:MAG: antibiotic biosynthesis monooxygenase [Anaerolineales bacterium]|nr:antibiotic biosynthesis monooxygenase [Anaerolineales bacterium]
MIIVAGKATIKAGTQAEALAVMQTMIDATQAEAGCISYQIYQNPYEATEFFIFEEWDSLEALAQHFQTDHMREFSQRIPNYLVGELQIKRYDVSHDQYL